MSCDIRAWLRFFSRSCRLLQRHSLASNCPQPFNKQIFIKGWSHDNFTCVQRLAFAQPPCDLRDADISFRKLINPSWTRNNWRIEILKHIALDFGQLSPPACAIPIDCSKDVSIRKMSTNNINDERNEKHVTQKNCWNSIRIGVLNNVLFLQRLRWNNFKVFSFFNKNWILIIAVAPSFVIVLARKRSKV